MNYLPTCTFRLEVQHLYQVSFKSKQGCRRSWEDKLWWDGMTEGRTKQTLNASLPFYDGGIKIAKINAFNDTDYNFEDNSIHIVHILFFLMILLFWEHFKWTLGTKLMLMYTRLPTCRPPLKQIKEVTIIIALVWAWCNLPLTTRYPAPAGSLHVT